MLFSFEGDIIIRTWVCLGIFCFNIYDWSCRLLSSIIEHFHHFVMKFGFLILVGHALQYIQGAIHVNYQSPSVIAIESCTNSLWLVFKKEKIYKALGIIMDNAKMTYNPSCKETYNLSCKQTCNLKCRRQFRGLDHKSNSRFFLTPKWIYL